MADDLAAVLELLHDGDRRWRSLRAEGHQWSHVGPAGELLWPSSLPSILRREAAGRRRSIGRDAFVVRGWPRREPESRPRRMFMGADEVEFLLDAERGVLLWLEQRLDGAPFRRVAMTSVAFDEDLDPTLFEFPDSPEVWEGSLPVPGERRPPPAPRPRQGPPDGVLGQPVALFTLVARTDSMVVAVDRIVAYPTGFEFGITIRTDGRTGDHRPRAWSGVAAFPGESVRVAVMFAAGRRCVVDNFSSTPAGNLHLAPVHGHGTETRFDQQFWVEPLPPPGPLGVVVGWERRGLAETRADLDAGAILEASSRAQTLWP